MRSFFGPRDVAGGRVQVWGCSPGCLLLSLLVSVILTVVLNVLLNAVLSVAFTITVPEAASLVAV